ncbi:MAG: hypothetical protein OEY14_16510, partial [Myxococcales bacterium]|nr:hypothetical protein [Myxococcales bacterium]
MSALPISSPWVRSPPYALSIALLLTLAPLGACGAETPCGSASLAPPPSPPAFAVITSDYLSTAVALLDSDGERITEAWIDSGTTRPGLNTALSGDVDLPGAVIAGELVLLDRLDTDLITRIDLTDGSTIAQWHVSPPAILGEAAFAPNPQDLLRLPGGDLLISRFEPNEAPDAGALDRGDDLLRLDGRSGAPIARIGLEPLRARIDGVTVFARPARMLALDGGLLVGLAR